MCNISPSVKKSLENFKGAENCPDFTCKYNQLLHVCSPSKEWTKRRLFFWGTSVYPDCCRDRKRTPINYRYVGRIDVRTVCFTMEDWFLRDRVPVPFYYSVALHSISRQQWVNAWHTCNERHEGHINTLFAHCLSEMEMTKYLKSMVSLSMKLLDPKAN